MALLVTSWDEMKAGLGFDQEQQASLALLAPSVAQSLPGLVRIFHDQILGAMGQREQVLDAVLSEGLYHRLHQYLWELVSGPHDQAHLQRCQEAARVFHRLNIPLQKLFLAFGQFRDALDDLAAEHLGPADARRASRAAHHAIDMDLAIFNTTYMKVHETQQLRSLQELIIRYMPVTLLCLDASGNVTAATRPAVSLFGKTAHIGLHYTEFIPDDLLDAADFCRQVDFALASGQELTIPNIVRGTGPEARHYRIHVVPLEHDLARLLLHIVELTDVVQAEARLQQAAALARIGAMAATMANEIRNPLTAISATLQVFGSSMALQERHHQVMDKVHEQVGRLDRLVSDLLGYARPVTAHPEHVSLVEIAEEAIRTSGVQATLLARGATEATADPTLLRQVLVNLLHNARDAVEAGGRILVEAGPGPVLFVRDDGPGIPEQAMENLFSPFITTKARGTGLGLAVCRKFAEAMGAEVTLEAARGASDGLQGACFKVSLPLLDGAGHTRKDEAPAPFDAAAG